MQISSLKSNNFGAQIIKKDGRVERLVKINNPSGLHCRPSANIVKITNMAPGMDVLVSPAKNPAAKSNIAGSVLSLLMLAAAKDSEYIVSVPQDYPARVYKALIKSFEAKSDDDMARISELFLKKLSRR